MAAKAFVHNRNTPARSSAAKLVPQVRTIEWFMLVEVPENMMKMNSASRCIGALVTIAGAATSALSQTTLVVVETSIDGVHWAGGTRTVTPGSTVQYRYRVSFSPDGATTIPVGLAAMNFQPTISNFISGDVHLAFASQGNNSSGGSVTEESGAYGRIAPFASTGPAATNPATSGNRYSVISHVGGSGGAPGGSYWRIARNDVTRWMGTGPTSTTAAVNNYNGAGGITCTQKNSGSVSTNDPAFNAAIANITIAKFAFTASSNTAERTLVIDAPIAGFSRNTSTGNRDVTWFTNSSGSTLKAPVMVTPAQVLIRGTPPPPPTCESVPGGAFAFTSQSRSIHVSVYSGGLSDSAAAPDFQPFSEAVSVRNTGVLEGAAAASQTSSLSPDRIESTAVVSGEGGFMNTGGSASDLFDVRFTMSQPTAFRFSGSWQVLDGFNGQGDFQVSLSGPDGAMYYQSPSTFDFPMSTWNIGGVLCPGDFHLVSNTTAFGAGGGDGSSARYAFSLILINCIADFNNDGGVDGSDVGAFFASWQSGDQIADLNNDGGIDGDDVGYFFRRWEAGC